MFRPIITYSLIGLNVTVFLLMGILGVNLVSPNGYSLYNLGAFFGPSIMEDGQWWRFISSMFLHGGIIHLLVNCYSLKNIGPTLEFFIGRWAYLALYFLSGIIGGLFVLIFSPKALTIGASGAIFGIFTAEVGLFIKYKKYISREFYRKVMRSFIIVMGLNLFIGFSLSNISNAAHMGGAVAGFSLIFLPPFTNFFEKKGMYLFLQ